MSWLFDFFGNIGDRKPVVSATKVPMLQATEERSISISDSFAVTDWGHLIYSYVTNLYGREYSSYREDKARKEIEGRGLAFGQIKILRGSSRTLELGLIGEQKLTRDEVQTTLERVLTSRQLDTNLEIVRESFAGRIQVNFKDPLDNTFRGISWGGSNNGKQTTRKEFLSISCWETGGLYQVEVHSDEAIRVFIQVAEKLGFFVGSKHYAHETPVRIEDIIIYATRWEDPQSGCRYLDVLLRPELVKHEIWHGSNSTDKRTEGSFKGLVLACTGGVDWWPKITINNKPVYSTLIETPTVPMLKAKDKFAKESIRNCACGKPATQQVRLVRFEVTDDLGGFSSGGIDYACDSEDCLSRAKSQKCVRAETSPYKQEVW